MSLSAVHSPCPCLYVCVLSVCVCAELGERGRDLSAKDLVSSIISAANKKMRKKEKPRSGDSVDTEIESEPASYNERNIDREIELRRVKEASQTTVSKETSHSMIVKDSSHITLTKESSHSTMVK